MNDAPVKKCNLVLCDSTYCSAGVSPATRYDAGETPALQKKTFCRIVMNRACIHLFLLIVSFLCGDILCLGDDVSTFHYNEQRTGLSSNAGPDSPEIIWSFSTNGSISASPIVGEDGTVYIACTDGFLYALDSKGEQKWEYKAEDSIYGTPSITKEGALVFGDLSGHVYQVSVEGDLNWKFSVDRGTDRRILESVLIDEEGTIYFGSWNESIYALDSKGNLKWRNKVSGLISSAAALDDDGNVYLAAKEAGYRNLGIYKFSSNHSHPQWVYSQSLRTTASRIISNLCIDLEQKQIYFGVCRDEDGVLYGIDFNGNRRFQVELPKGIISSPAISSDGMIYTGCLDGKVYAIEADDGDIEWEFQTDGYFVMSSPSVDVNGVIYVGDSDGILYAISSEGEELWRYETKANITSSPVIDPSGILYLTTHGSKVFAIHTPAAVDDWKNYE